MVFDPAVISYEELAKLFFETHDFTQVNRQGPDIGTQYRSEIFYQDESQRQVAEKLLGVLQAKGFRWPRASRRPANSGRPKTYHQNYYVKKGGSPYCHVYRKIF